MSDTDAHATILYAEDEPLLRLTIADLLEAEGWRVVACHEGLSARARLEGGERLDLLLFDKEMPGVGGLELARRARGLEHRRRLPVVVLSADDCAAEAERAGADEFLLKPRDLHALTRTIKRLLAALGGEVGKL